MNNTLTVGKTPLIPLEIDGVLIPKKLVNDKTSHTCVNCNKYSFSREDDIYLTKYKNTTL